MKTKIIPFILAAVILCAMCTSCSTMMALIDDISRVEDDISMEKPYLNLKIFQTYEGNRAALAHTKKHDLVKIETVSDVYYDGKQISGDFTLIGTYSYEAKDERMRTVPVFVLTQEYDEYKDHWNQLYPSL